MNAPLLPWPRAKFFAPNTNYPLAGGKVYTYEAGTNTPLATYTSSSGLVANTNPVILDANGEAAIYLGNGLAYKINITDASDVQVPGYPVDNLTGAEISGTAAQLRADLANASDVSLGDAMVATKRTVASSIATTVHNVIEQMAYNVKADFGAVGDGIVDDTAALNAAYVGGNRTVYWPPGNYKVTGPIYYEGNTKTIFSEGAFLNPVPIAGFTMLTFPGKGPWGYAIFVNKNWTSATIVDTLVEFDGVNCFPSSPFNGHVILSRKLQNLQIRNGAAANCADYNATLASTNVLVADNVTIGMTNCSYDFWEGCSYVIVQGNVARNCNAGINWNATDTYDTDSLAANHVWILNNVIFGGPGGGIFVSPLTAGSSINDVLIQGNYVNQFNSAGGGGSVPNGIIVQRSSSVTIDGNTLDSIGLLKAAIIVSADAFAGVSDACTITNNEVINSTIGGNAMITAFGTNHYISGNTAHSATADIGILIDSPTTTIINKTIIGATTQILNQTSTGTPTTPALELLPDVVNYRFKVRQDFRTDANLAQSTTYGATATGTNLATAYALTSTYTQFSTVAASTGAVLPAAGVLTLGKELVIWNDGANALTLYANTGDTINGVASQSIAAGSKMRVVCANTTVWKISGT